MTAAIVPLRRGRQLTQDGRQVLRLYPTGNSNSAQQGHWLYAIGFRDGRTKLGMTGAPRKRMVQHWVASEGEIEWVHLFGRSHYSRRAAAIERRAVKLASETAARIRLTETFRSLAKADAIRCVRQAIAEQG